MIRPVALAVGVLRTTIAKRAIQCVMAELPAGRGENWG